MVQINLIPKGVHKQRSIQEGLRGNLQLGAVILVLALAIWVLMLPVLVIGKARLYSVDKRWQKLRQAITEIDKLTRENKELSNKLDVVKGLAEQKFSWSSLLTRISSSVPPEIWLTGVSVERESGEVSGYEEPSGAMPQGGYRVLAIRGQAVSLKGEEPVGSVGRFLSSLREDAHFAENFSAINLGPINKMRIGNMDVMRFELFCKFK